MKPLDRDAIEHGTAFESMRLANEPRTDEQLRKRMDGVARAQSCSPVGVGTGPDEAMGDHVTNTIGEMQDPDRPVTFRHLLTHTSGLSPLRFGHS